MSMLQDFLARHNAPFSLRLDRESLEHANPPPYQVTPSADLGVDSPKGVARDDESPVDIRFTSLGSSGLPPEKKFDATAYMNAAASHSERPCRDASGGISVVDEPSSGRTMHPAANQQPMSQSPPQAEEQQQPRPQPQQRPPVHQQSHFHPHSHPQIHQQEHPHPHLHQHSHMAVPIPPGSGGYHGDSSSRGEDDMEIDAPMYPDRLPRKKGPQAGTKNKVVKRYSNAKASNYCHICCRARKRGDHMICSNVTNGTCRKVICEKCFVTFGWDWEFARSNAQAWTCPHCENQCPSRAQCKVYSKANHDRKTGWDHF